MNIEEFEKIMQRDDKEEKEEDLEKIWDDKSEWFFKRTEKKQENFSDRLIFKIVKNKEPSLKLSSSFNNSIYKVGLL